MLWLKRGWVDATFLNLELVNHVLALVNPLVAQVRVLVDVAALIETSRAMNGGLPSSFHLHHGNVPAFRNLVMAESEHLWFLLVEFARVLNQITILVAFPVNGGPIMKLAVGSLASYGGLNLHIGNVLFQGLFLEAFVTISVVKRDIGSAHVIFRCLRDLF